MFIYFLSYFIFPSSFAILLLCRVLRVEGWLKDLQGCYPLSLACCRFNITRIYFLPTLAEFMLGLWWWLTKSVLVCHNGQHSVRSGVEEKYNKKPLKTIYRDSFSSVFIQPTYSGVRYSKLQRPRLDFNTKKKSK